VHAKKEEQISVFLKNRPAVLADLCEALNRANVNIRAISVLESYDIGTIRLVVDNVGIAEEALAEFGAAFIVVPVITIDIPNERGSLARVSRALGKASVNIEYLYATATPGVDHTVVVIRVDDMDLEKALTLDFKEP